MEEFIDIELLHFSKQKFQVFNEACKKNGISSRDAINKFFDNYILETFGVSADSINVDAEEIIEEY